MEESISAGNGREATHPQGLSSDTLKEKSQQWKYGCSANTLKATFTADLNRLNSTKGKGIVSAWLTFTLTAYSYYVLQNLYLKGVVTIAASFSRLISRSHNLDQDPMNGCWQNP